MPERKIPIQFLWVALMLGVCAVLVTACGASSDEAALLPSVHTWLLVKAPESPLPLDKPVNVRSRTEAKEGVSHVELYALELPSGETNVLIRSDAAPFDQVSFTASQIFIPLQKGHYVIQVVGYNRLGETSKSNIIGFDVE